MLSKIIGCFAVFLGVLWVVWPQILRGWVVGKVSWALFWLIAFSIFYPAASWIGRWGMNGWAAFVLAFVVLGSLLKTVINKSAEKIPLACFRIAGALNIVSGLFLIFRGHST